METGWAALAVPGEKERRHGSVAPLTTGRRERRKLTTAFTKWEDIVSHSFLPYL